MAQKKPITITPRAQGMITLAELSVLFDEALRVYGNLDISHVALFIDNKQCNDISLGRTKNIAVCQDILQPDKVGFIRILE